MIQSLAALLGAALTVIGCYAVGALLVDRLRIELRRSERVPLAFTLGAACVHLAVFLILTVRGAYWPVFVVLLLGLILAAARRGSLALQGKDEEAVSQNLKRVCILCFTPFTLLYLLHAWAPEISPDGSSYHLGYVLRYLRSHGFERITTDMYAALSAGVEMLYVPAFSIGQHSAAALVHLAFTIALAWAVFAYGRRLGKPWVGAAAAILTYASPVVGIDGSSAYIDLGTAAVLFSTFYWLEIWEETRDKSLLIPIGLMAGYACATKYTAFLMVLLALGWVALRARSWRPVATVFLFATLMFGPWLLKNWIILKNPVAPFADTVFRNRYFHPMFELEYVKALQDYGVTNKWSLPLEVTVRGGNTQGLLGLAFLAAPIALLSLRDAHGRRLLLAALLLSLPFYANIGTRFLIPPLPFLSLAMALAIGSAPVLLGALMIFHAFFSWPSEMHRYSDKYVWKLDHLLFREALRIIPQEQYLRAVSEDYRAARMVEAVVPRGERILGSRGVPYAYCNRDFLVDYQAAFNQTLMDSINLAVIRDYQPNTMVSFKFPEQTVERVRILQTAKAVIPQLQWSVHEVRFYRQGNELPRAPQWRLRAWPNPWEVQLAFDSSLATRWRTWETVRPGDYLDVDFGQAEPIDEIRLDSSYDYVGVKLQAEVRSPDGKWALLSNDPMPSTTDLSHYSLRLAATYEMKQRGVDYLLLGDDYVVTADVRDDPEAWGLTQVAAGYGVHLYRVAQ